jgi:prepilin-type N-terminal cleavage/methylation domain-containing protein
LIKRKRNGFSLIELAVTATVVSIIALIFVKVLNDLNKSITKTQQYNDLQRLAQQSLSEISSQIRQSISVRTTQAGDIPENTTFAVTPGGANQVCIYVPKLSNPGDDLLADRITYTLGTYQGRTGRLLQQLTTYKRDMSGNVVIDVSYPAIPILYSMESYRANPAVQQESTLMYLYNSTNYRFDKMNFFWNYDPDPTHPRGVMAVGMILSGSRGFYHTKFYTSTIMTSRTISGVPR